MIKRIFVLSLLLLMTKLTFAQAQYEVGKKLERVILDLGTNYTRYQDADGYDVLFYTVNVPNDAEGFGNFIQSIYLHFDKNVCIALDMTYPIVAAGHFELSYNDQLFSRISEKEWKNKDGIYFIVDREEELVIISIQNSYYYEKTHKK